MSGRVVVLLLAPLCWGLVGCGPTTDLTGQQSRLIDTPDSRAVLVAGAALLRREFGRVDVDEGRLAVDSLPVEYSTRRESGTARDLYGGRSTMRRVAHFSVGRKGESSVARLRIDVERQDTARVASAQPAGTRISDSPGYTPIERDAATSERQNTVWSRVGRDRRLERMLLDELEERFAAPPTETAPAPAPASERPENPAGGSP
ncbi:MAG: hypothetical protein PVJ57_05390 [Phycisphaerae bacterium]|jgi:hypothetical protein